MIPVHCYRYSLGKEIDLNALSGIADLKKVDGAGVMRAQYGDVTVLLFKSGELRAFVRGSELDQLKEALLSAGMKITSLLQAIRQAGVEFDEQKVFSEGAPMEFQYYMPKGTRPELADGVHVDSLREMVYAPYALAPEFQLERNAVQAGENSGRRLAANAKDKEGVGRAVVDYLKRWQLGVAEHSSKQDKTGRSQYDVEVFTVRESAFAAGMPVVNKALCHFIRGVIRGAYARFLEAENVSVKETRCWGLGDTYCEFEMQVTPM